MLTMSERKLGVGGAPLVVWWWCVAFALRSTVDLFVVTSRRGLGGGRNVGGMGGGAKLPMVVSDEVSGRVHSALDLLNDCVCCLLVVKICAIRLNYNYN